MEKKPEILKDPNIKTNWLSMSIAMIIVCVFTYIGFSSGIIWMQAVVKAFIWGSTIIASIVGLGLLVKGGVVNSKIKPTSIPIRIPQWWSVFTGVTYSVVLWYVTGGIGYLVGMYLFSKAVLSINYSIVLEDKDREYTEFIQMINSPLGRVYDFLNGFKNTIDKNELDKYPKRERQHWDVDLDDEDKK